MIPFVLLLLTVYGSAHYYVFRKIKAAFVLKPIVRAAIITLMLLMITAPIMIRVMENYGYESTACLLSYIGYAWMGVLFVFFAISILIDACRLLILTVGKLTRQSPALMMPSPFYVFIIPLVISLSINAYGFFEAKQIRTEHITIETDKLPQETERLRIVQISDVHIGIIVREERLGRIIAAAEKAKPDMLVSTGDLLDGQTDNIAFAALMIAGIQPQFGKFAVMGNHEFFAGVAKSMEFHRQAGFIVLRGEALMIADMIGIAGVDDERGRRFDDYRYTPEKELLERLSPKAFRLLLKHRPNLEPESSGFFDLQLSGHTHQGQIFPFLLLTSFAFPYNSGHYRLPQGGQLYVSRGSGTWGPPVRFMAPPEVTVIDLVRKK